MYHYAIKHGRIKEKGDNTTMKVYINESASATQNKVALDDMILTKNLPTTAGSKMLDGYKSLFEAEVVTKLESNGYAISGKINVGEFGIDLLGETSYYGACVCEDGTFTTAVAEALKEKDVKAVVGLDVNGAPRRAAALGGLTYIKPTYGTVSRYGTIPAACSGETVCVTAGNADKCREILSVIAGHDDKDGTSLPEEKCVLLKENADRTAVKKIAVAKSMLEGVDDETKTFIEAFKAKAAKCNIEIVEVEAEELLAAKAAWNILMSAEVCNNVSRYDGIKFGYRTPKYDDIDELYTNSRTEAFGYLLKSTILYGSDTLSTENYMKVYDKALRVRRVLCEYLNRVLGEVDGILLPACSKTKYTEAEVKANNYIAYDESLYTAPASITGLPVLVTCGVQVIGKAFSENSLLDMAAMFEKECE